MGLQKLLRSAASAGTLTALSLATSDIGKLQKVEIIHVVVNSLIFRSTMRLLGNTSYAAIGPQIPMIPFVGLDYPTIEECSLMRSTTLNYYSLQAQVVDGKQFDSSFKEHCRDKFSSASECR
jgi:hypothetical protein